MQIVAYICIPLIIIFTIWISVVPIQITSVFQPSFWEILGLFSVHVVTVVLPTYQSFRVPRSRQIEEKHSINEILSDKAMLKDFKLFAIKSK